MNYEDHIGSNIREVRLKLGLSQQYLADLCGFSNTTLSNYENGKKKPGLDTLAKIAKALKVNIDRLYYGDENKSFITSEADDGRKIVNSVYLLWEKGVIRYYEYDCGYDDYVINKNKKTRGIYVLIEKYHVALKRLLTNLDEIKQKRDTYKDPDQYIEGLLDSVATEINNEIKR